VEFPVRCAGECSELLNAVPLYWADKRGELPKVDFLYLHFTNESPARVARVLAEYRRGGTPPKEFTRGLYKRGVL
jgi:putative protease